MLTRDEVLADPDIDPYFGYVMRDAPVVALDKARHQGDIIAVVVAEDEMTAAEALEMVDIEYEELPAVIDTLEAMAQGAPIVQEEMKPIAWDMKPIHGTNIAHHATLMRGDVERGFAESDYIFEDTYSVPPVQHCALELHGVIASYTDDGITVWTNCQSPYPLRRELERMFRSPVRVIVPFVGGGFGSKSRDRIEATIVAAAKLARRPVRLLLSQEETFLTFIRPALACWTKTGVKADGTLVARHHTFVADVGGYGISGPRNANNTLKVATGPYRIPHVLVDCYAVYTNKPPSAPYRGLPTTQHTMAYESQMDRMARALGIDPVEMRMKNFLREGDVHVPGDLLRSVHADECLEKVVDAIGYRDKQSSPGPDGKLRGKGLSCTIKYTITPPVPTAATQAEVALRGDGLFEALVGSVNLGQGSDTILAQITAEALGVPLDLIRVTHSDTGVTPEDNGTTASRGTFHSGNAVLDAANRVRSELIAIGSRLLEVEQSQVQVTSQGLAVNGEPSRTVGFPGPRPAARRAHRREGELRRRRHLHRRNGPAVPHHLHLLELCLCRRRGGGLARNGRDSRRQNGRRRQPREGHQPPQRQGPARGRHRHGHGPHPLRATRLGRQRPASQQPPDGLSSAHYGAYPGVRPNPGGAPAGRRPLWRQGHRGGRRGHHACRHCQRRV